MSLECFVLWVHVMRTKARQWVVIGGCLLASACGSSESSDTAEGSFAPRATQAASAGSGAAFPGANGAAPTGAPGIVASTGTSAPATPSAPGTAPPIVMTLPPEMETSVDLQLPQASEHYVYAVNPDAGTVAIIDARTQVIRTLKTGTRPTYLRTLAGTDHAIVLNIGSNKASVIRMIDDAPQKTDLPIHPGANAIAIAPDAKHAVVYFNSSYGNAGNGAGSYQDVAVLSLSQDGSADQATRMTVGFRPRDVFFSEDSTKAYVVNEDGVSMLSFDEIQRHGSGIAKLATFGGTVDQKNLDVAITPDGRFALARTDGQGELHLLELQTGKVRSLKLIDAYTPPPPPPPAANGGEDAGMPPEMALPVVATDLDLMPSGRAALAVLRNQAAVLRIPLPEAFDDPKQVKTIQVDQEVIGSCTIAPDGNSAIAYTTAGNFERVVLIDLAKDSAPHTVLLRKAIQAVAYTPDSKTALITHTKVPGDKAQPGISPDEVIDRSFGYSLLRIASADVKLQVTPTKLGPIAMVPDGSYLFILFRDDAARIKEVQRVAQVSFLVDPIIQLENPPISLGVAKSSGTVFVNLEHPDGRMTFIDWQEPLEKLKTVTGFELNSRIRN